MRARSNNAQNRVARRRSHTPCFFLSHAHRLRPANREGKGPLTVFLNMLRAGRAPKESIGPPALLRLAIMPFGYCAACVLSAAMSASLRKVITPIWLVR